MNLASNKSLIVSDVCELKKKLKSEKMVILFNIFDHDLGSIIKRYEKERYGCYGLLCITALLLIYFQVIHDFYIFRTTTPKPFLR